MKKYILTVFAVWLAVAGGAQALERTTGAGTSVGASSTDALVKTLQEVMNAGFADLRTRMDDMNTRMDGVENKLDAMLTCSRKGMVFNPDGENPDNDSCVKVKKLDCTVNVTALVAPFNDHYTSAYGNNSALATFTNPNDNLVSRQRIFTTDYRGNTIVHTGILTVKHGSGIKLESSNNLNPDAYSADANINKTALISRCQDGEVGNFQFVTTIAHTHPEQRSGTDGDPN